MLAISNTAIINNTTLLSHHPLDTYPLPVNSEYLVRNDKVYTHIYCLYAPFLALSLSLFYM